MSSVSVESVKENITRMNEIRGLIDGYIQQNLVPGTDYGEIKTDKFTSKPSLFKPGSEKMCTLFQLKARFKRDDETWEMAGKPQGTFFYVCELIDGNGNIWGEGRGAEAAGSKSRDVNAAIKIAEKRAQVDAVLRVFALSERFTQDIEDMPDQTVSTKPAPAVNTKIPWQDVRIHFGKNKGKRLGDLQVPQIRWYAENWKPDPKYGIKPADRELQEALKEATAHWAKKKEPQEDDSIPTINVEEPLTEEQQNEIV